jgi:amidase
VDKLRAAGFVIVGTTTLPEWGITPVSQARRFGPTNNPWDVTRTPGGSSGGSAAAVASGMVPIAHANDGGGSTRIPAACCGLVGLKPQRGRISLAPEIGEAFLVQDGVLTRTVAETARAARHPERPRSRRLRVGSAAAEPFAAQAAREVSRKRIAVTTLPPIPDMEVDPVCAKAAHDAAALLESLGHEVVEADPPWQDASLIDTFTANFAGGLATLMAFIGSSTVASDGCGHGAAELGDLRAGEGPGLRPGVALRRSSCTASPAPSCSGRATTTSWSRRRCAEAPVAHDTINPCSDDPMADYYRSARFTPTPRR